MGNVSNRQVTNLAEACWGAAGPRILRVWMDRLSYRLAYTHLPENSLNVTATVAHPKGIRSPRWRLCHGHVGLSGLFPFPVAHPVFLGSREFRGVCLSDLLLPRPQRVISLSGFLHVLSSAAALSVSKRVAERTKSLLFPICL